MGDPNPRKKIPRPEIWDFAFGIFREKTNPKSPGFGNRDPKNSIPKPPLLHYSSFNCANENFQIVPTPILGRAYREGVG